MPIKLRKPIKLTKRTYTTRTVLRIYSCVDGFAANDLETDFTVPDRSSKWLKTIPELHRGAKYRYYTQTICNINGETLTGKPNFITPLLTYELQSNQP